jgi:hypothetical protein
VAEQARKLTSSKYRQTLIGALLLCISSPSEVCFGAAGPQIAIPQRTAYAEVGGAATSDVKSDAGAPASRTPDNRAEAKIVWELPAELHVREPSIGGINASLVAEELARWNIGGNGSATYVSNRAGFHPGTRVIVDVAARGTVRTQSGKSGAIRHYLAEFRNLGYWPYRLCFESFASEVHSKGGDAWIQVQVNKHGRVVTSRLLKSSYDHPPIAQCISSATRSIRLSRNQTTGATLNLRVRVFPGDAPLAANRKLSEGKAAIEPSLLRAALSTVENAVGQCIQDGLGRDPKLWGRLAMLVQFNKQGRVVQSEEYDSHFPDVSVVKCINLAYRDLRLAPLTEQANVVVALRVGTLPTLIGETNIEPR